MTQTQPDGFLALPALGTGQPVLVLHAWWGLNEALKSFCTRLAEAGFIAFAPDLYDGQLSDTIEDAETLSNALDSAQATVKIGDAASFLREQVGQTNIAVIGFSLGAFLALDFAATAPENVDAVVLFYGTGGDDFSGSDAAYLGHFAQNDEFEPQSGVDALEAALRKAGRPVEFHVYPKTGHWFFEPDRLDAFNAAAAELAWQRTLAFLNRQPK